MVRVAQPSALTSGFGLLSWNCINPILAFSILVGPPALFMTLWLSAIPSTISVSSIVPPTFLTIRISRRSTLEEVGVTRRVTAATAIGARVEEYCETICERASASTPGPRFGEQSRPGARIEYDMVRGEPSIVFESRNAQDILTNGTDIWTAQTA